MHYIVMLLITALIIIVLILCIKTFVMYILKDCKAPFSNTVLIDVAGIRQHYGITSLASGINYRSGTLNYQIDNGEDNDETGTDSGGGNFTNRVSPDSRYLEDVMANDCWSDICMRDSLSGKVVGTTCKSKCSVNPGPGYIRTFGGNQITYNDNMSDTQYKEIQRIGSNIIVPWSESFNNFPPANPSIR
jgi:hypothetical protein